MPKGQNIFQRIKNWYKERGVRKAWIWLGVAAFVVAAASQFYETGYIFKVAGCIGIIAAILSISDTWISKRIYNQKIKEVERRFYANEMENFGEVTRRCYGFEDYTEIKKKNLAFWAVIGLKILFIIILVALLFF